MKTATKKKVTHSRKFTSRTSLRPHILLGGWGNCNRIAVMIPTRSGPPPPFNNDMEDPDRPPGNADARHGEGNPGQGGRRAEYKLTTRPTLRTPPRCCTLKDSTKKPKHSPRRPMTPRDKFNEKKKLNVYFPLDIPAAPAAWRVSQGNDRLFNAYNA